ncbi:MAG: SLATT domain-containing protein [Candidatus Thiodiazotropha sp. (ex Monitilora ramsayi)]|nr:SLATT domain-containing protein [Candidatus Thiodiazotropha sp. (ex Monitilora ramsayi)]
MNKEDLLKSIAEAGYNVGFGAKKHYATYDIVEKTPGFIGFFSMAFGIYALVFKNLSNEFLSASFIILGIIGLYISLYDHKKLEYEELGTKLTRIYNKLGNLYRKAKHVDGDKINDIEAELSKLQSEYYTSCISKQILFSDWYAHYKFFWQFQIEWVNEQKQFKFFRDKIPLTLSIAFILFIMAISAWWFNFAETLCALAT